MAKISIDVLLMVFDSGLPYIQLPANYRSDVASTEKIKTTLNQVRDSLEAGRRDVIYGVSYKTSKAGEVGIPWIELTNPTPETLKDCQLWLDDIGAAWAKENPGWVKQPGDSRKGYTGYQLAKN